jgi:hypothetical protein
MHSSELAKYDKPYFPVFLHALEWIQAQEDNLLDTWLCTFKVSLKHKREAEEKQPN